MAQRLGSSTPNAAAWVRFAAREPPPNVHTPDRQNSLGKEQSLKDSRFLISKLTKKLQ